MQSGAAMCNVLNRGRWPIWHVNLGLSLRENSNSRLSSISDEIEVLVSLMLTIRAVSAGRQWEILPAHKTVLYQVLLITRRLVRDTAKGPSQRVEGKDGEEIAWCKRYLKLEQHDKCLHQWILLSSYVTMLQYQLDLNWFKRVPLKINSELSSPGAMLCNCLARAGNLSCQLTCLYL